MTQFQEQRDKESGHMNPLASERRRSSSHGVTFTNASQQQEAEHETLLKEVQSFLADLEKRYAEQNGPVDSTQDKTTTNQKNTSHLQNTSSRQTCDRDSNEFTHQIEQIKDLVPPVSQTIGLLQETLHTIETGNSTREEAFGLLDKTVRQLFDEYGRNRPSNAVQTQTKQLLQKDEVFVDGSTDKRIVDLSSQDDSANSDVQEGDEVANDVRSMQEKERRQKFERVSMKFKNVTDFTRRRTQSLGNMGEFKIRSYSRLNAFKSMDVTVEEDLDFMGEQENEVLQKVDPVVWSEFL